jgi:hypothetical protein
MGGVARRDNTTVSAEVASSTAAHHGQNRPDWSDSRAQEGQRTIEIQQL